MIVIVYERAFQQQPRKLNKAWTINQNHVDIEMSHEVYNEFQPRI